MEKRWNLKKHDRAAAAALADELGVHPLTAALLISRGYSDAISARAFLDPQLSDLNDPYLLKGMDAAVERIDKAINAQERVLIWGDYDVDGTTGTVLLRKCLRKLGLDSEFHIPNRFTEGYGINVGALEAAKSRGCTLAISVDCGIRAFDQADWARANGMDLIITDHHLSDESRGVPNAYAVVNPNQAGCAYPDKTLAGVGVAFKLASGLLSRAGRANEAQEFLEIAAIGTIADIMQLTGENRAIVSHGLRSLRQTQNYGLKALMEVADCRSEMSSYHVGFRIAPRINAAGRMDAARQVVELLDTEDFSVARNIATELDTRNRERQQVQQKITDLALTQQVDQGDTGFNVLAGEGWHRGVIGLAASRIAERTYRPTLVLSVENGVAHGSVRSIPNFDVLNALESCSHLFVQFGGHAAAAGVQLREENIGSVREALNGFMAGVVSAKELSPVLEIDAHVSPTSVSLQLLNDLARLEPFGAGNPKPVLMTKGLRLRFDPTVMKEKHLKLYLEDDDRRRFQAVWWDGVNKGKGRTLKAGSGIEIAYTLDANTWQGNTDLQLVVEDIREHN